MGAKLSQEPPAGVDKPEPTPQPTRNVIQRPTDSRKWLEEITTETKPRPTAAVLYGPPGIGKSSFGAAVPGAVFLIDQAEDGISTLKAGGLVDAGVPVLPPATTWFDVSDMLFALAEQDHDYKALVIDTVGGVEKLCHTHVCNTEFGGDWTDKGFASFSKGYEVSLPTWQQFLRSLDRLRRDRNMAVVLLAHSIVKPFKNPEAEDYDRFIPDLHPKTWNLSHRWADMVLFCNYHIETTKEGGRTKGKGGQRRVIHTEYSAAYEAKNRHNLPAEIEMGDSGAEAWANLRAAMTTNRKDNHNGNL